MGAGGRAIKYRRLIACHTALAIGAAALAQLAPISDHRALAGSTTLPSGRVDVFIRGQDFQLWHRVFDGNAWTSWEPLGGLLSADPTAVASADGTIDVFGRGVDYRLWHRTWNGSGWTPWALIGGRIASGIGAVTTVAGHFDLFVAGGDGALLHATWHGTTLSKWDSLGGILISSPSAVSASAGQIDVFGQGTDAALWRRHFDGTTWTPWETLGGGFRSGPGAAGAGGKIDLFGVGLDSALWHRQWDGAAWGPWQSFGGLLTADPFATAASGTGGPTDVFARGTDNALWHRRGTGSSWSPWEWLSGIALGGPDPITLPVPVYGQQMNLDCETAALQMALAALGYYYSQASLFSLQSVDGRAPEVDIGQRAIVRWGDPYVNYVGNVNGTDRFPPSGYGIYYPPILAIAQRSGAPQATGGEGLSASTVYQAVADGHLVEVWVEVGWYRPHVGIWTAWDGRGVRYSLDEHTVVLSGLTPTQVRVNDPWHGTQYWVSKGTFEVSWADFNNMAVIFQ